MLCACENEFYFLEDLMKKRILIYYNACDVGVPIESKKFEDEAREALKTLMKTYHYEVEKYEGGSTIRIFIGFERDGTNGYRGVLLTFAYNEITAKTLPDINAKAYIDINIFSSTSAVSGYRS